jgi:hypothetical protein
MGTRRIIVAGGPPCSAGNQHWPEPPTDQEQLYLDPPIPSNVFDDEFNSGSPDLALRGWVFVNTDTNTPMVRVGDVYPYEYAWTGGVGALTVNQYRSRLQNGRLALQLSTLAGAYAIYKPVALPTTSPTHGGLLWARFGSSRALDTAGPHGFTNIGFWGSNAGVPDNNNRNFYEIYYEQPSTFLHWAGVDGGVYTDHAQTLGDTSPADTFAMMSTTGFGTKFLNVDTQTGADASSPFYASPAFPAASRIAFAGFGFFVPVPAPERIAASIRYFDFIRLRVGDMKALCSSSLWLYP